MSILFEFDGITVVSTPARPGPSSVEFSSTQFAAASTNPFSGQQQINDWSASMWSASVQLPPMTRAGGGADWSSFLTQCRGMTNGFLIGDPSAKTPQGSVLVTGSAPLVNGANQTGYSLNTKGWVPGATKVLRRGDWIQLIYRLHRIEDDVDADAGGNAVLPIYPQIRDVPADGQAIITNNAVGLFRLASNTNKFSISEASIYGFQFSIREAF